MPDQSLTSMDYETAVKVLVAAGKPRVTAQQVRQVVEDGDLLRPGDKINLLEYVAYLLKCSNGG